MQFLASQEDDEPRVVWRASPQVAHPRRAVPQHSTPAPSGAFSAVGDTPPSASSDSQGSVATGEPAESGARIHVCVGRPVQDLGKAEGA